MGSRFQYVIVPDVLTVRPGLYSAGLRSAHIRLLQPGVYDEVVIDVDGIIHTNFPVTMAVTEVDGL